ncbi:hypothetical protein GCM10009646_88980 [Streptomyces aureus]
MPTIARIGFTELRAKPSIDPIHVLAEWAEANGDAVVLGALDADPQPVVHRG